MAVRNILHIDKLEAFEEFLRFEGYMILPLSKNPYEVLRAKKGRGTVIIYRRSEAKEHLSVMDKDYGLVEKFLRDWKGKDPRDVLIEEELPWN